MSMNLTPAQAAVLLELRKVLMTVEQINTTLKNTITLVRDAPAVAVAAEAEAEGPSRLTSASPTLMGGGRASSSSSRVDYGYLRQVGGLVQMLSEAIAQGKGVFGKALGVEGVEAGREGGGDDRGIGQDDGSRDPGHG